MFYCFYLQYNILKIYGISNLTFYLIDLDGSEQNKAQTTEDSLLENSIIYYSLILLVKLISLIIQ